MKQREKEALYPKRQRELAISYQQDYCLPAPVRKPALQTDGSAVAITLWPTDS
jgi:hypothetical protein